MPGQANKFKVNRGTRVPAAATDTLAARRAERQESTVGLIPVGEPVAMDGSAGTTVFAMIAPDQLADNPDNDPTRVKNVSDLANVASVGILQALLVVPTDVFLEAFPQHAELVGDKPFVIQAGHRRKRAAIEYGVTEVPIYIRTDLSANGGDSIVRVLENLARVNLNPITEALEYQRLRDEFGMGVTVIADKLGFNHPRISKRLQLLELPSQLQAALVAGPTDDDGGLPDVDDDGTAPRRLKISEALELRKQPDDELRLTAWSLMQADKNLNVHAALAQAPKAMAAAAAPRQRASSDEPGEAAKAAATAPFQEAASARFPFCEKLIGAEPEPAEVLQVLARHSIDGSAVNRDTYRLAHRWLVKNNIGPADLRTPAAYMAEVGQSHPEVLVRVAYAIAVATDEVRLRNPNRVWDHRDTAYLARLQAVGYTPTAWENDRLAAVAH